ncbi:hypothetical protein JDV09_22125, partial [Mycobacterium sp. Y57]|uniref:tyrosine-type recombinase/integrase n=1 Tax=Mycolicibacterium xanthum TaxID=2796469 RepID=UPI00355872D8|nr:hypothetical protein [Mycolicibacterium xanthum]
RRGDAADGRRVLLQPAQGIPGVRVNGLDVLKAARKRQTAEPLAFGAGYGSGEYVASDEFGQPYHPNLLTFRWGKLLDELKIERVRPHDARYSCAALMHLRGVPVAVIATWLGRASAAFTMAVYAHSQNAAPKDAGTRLGRVVTTRDTESGSEAGRRPLKTPPNSAFRVPQSDSNRHWADYKNSGPGFGDQAKRFAEAIILTARQRF